MKTQIQWSKNNIHRNSVHLDSGALGARAPLHAAKWRAVLPVNGSTSAAAPGFLCSTAIMSCELSDLLRSAE